MTRALPKIKESSDAYMDLVNPPVVKLCTDAAEALEQIISKERSPGDKAVILLSLLQVWCCHHRRCVVISVITSHAVMMAILFDYHRSSSTPLRGVGGKGKWWSHKPLPFTCPVRRSPWLSLILRHKRDSSINL